MLALAFYLIVLLQAPIYLPFVQMNGVMPRSSTEMVPIETETATTTPTATPTSTITPTPSVSPTQTPSATPTQLAPATSTLTATPSAAYTPTQTPTGTGTATVTPTSSATATQINTAAATQTSTATPTDTAAPTSTLSPSPTTTSTPPATQTAGPPEPRRILLKSRDLSAIWIMGYDEAMNDRNSIGWRRTFFADDPTGWDYGISVNVSIYATEVEAAQSVLDSIEVDKDYGYYRDRRPPLVTADSWSAGLDDSGERDDYWLVAQKGRAVMLMEYRTPRQGGQDAIWNMMLVCEAIQIRRVTDPTYNGTCPLP